MLLLFDSVPVRSGGLIQLRDELTRAIARQAPVGNGVVLLSAAAESSTPTTNLEVIKHQRPKWGWAGRWWWYNHSLPRLARRHSADVVYSLSGILGARAASNFPSITSINNMVPFSPVERAQLPLLSVARMRLGLLRKLYVKSLRRADSVVLHSNHALEMLRPYAGDISDKTFVVLTGVPSDLDIESAAAAEHPYGGRPYLLYFSAFYPYKNHIRLIEAYEKCLLAVPDLPDLVIAGMPMDRAYFETVTRAIAARKLGARVKYAGTIDRSKIPVWIYHAVINFFPSTCETNPVTVAEILALAGVLACSDVPPLPEIVADAAEYFDPHSVDSMADTILSLFRNPERRAALSKRGPERARELSWDRCGAEIWRAADSAQKSFRRNRENRR